MPRTDSTLSGILIQNNDEAGLITLGQCAGAPSSLATAASKFAVGCILTDTTSGIAYVMNGTVASPSWKLSAGTKSLMAVSATIATTGNTDAYALAIESGTLTGVDFSGVEALAANDTNYITWTITNLGQAGAGTTAMLLATLNNTKSTGGTALAAGTKRSFSLTATGADLVVAAGDRLRIRAAASGTLANTVTFPAYILRFTGSV